MPEVLRHFHSNVSSRTSNRAHASVYALSRWIGVLQSESVEPRSVFKKPAMQQWTLVRTWLVRARLPFLPRPGVAHRRDQASRLRYLGLGIVFGSAAVSCRTCRRQQLSAVQRLRLSLYVREHHECCVFDTVLPTAGQLLLDSHCQKGDSAVKITQN